MAIKSFRDKNTENLSKGRFIKQFSGIEKQGQKRLAILRAASSIRDLAALPSNRLEALTGDRSGQYSIRINDQWRICFKWLKGDDGPSDVEITDYH